MKNYLVAMSRSWNIENIDRINQEIGGNWHLITKPEDLNLKKIKRIQPRYIFFPAWNWYIPENIYSRFECIVFHPTDLPFGRGGSPVQNLITRGIYQTKISALRASRGYDTGAIYMQRDLSLYGSAEEIYMRLSNTVFGMIKDIILNEPTPIKQQGIPVIFKRRQPAESRLPITSDLNTIFDYIRMLDAEGYPKAFIETEKLRFEFTRASLKEDKILADVAITINE